MTTLVAWMIVFIDYVVDQLFELCRTFDISKPLDVEAIRDFGESSVHTHPSPSFHVGIGLWPLPSLVMTLLTILSINLQSNVRTAL